MLRPIEEVIGYEQAKAAVLEALRKENIMPALVEGLMHPERTLSQNAKAVGLPTRRYAQIMASEPVKDIIQYIVVPVLFTYMRNMVEAAVEHASSPEGYRERETLFAMAGLIEQARRIQRTEPVQRPLSSEDAEIHRVVNVLLSLCK